MVFHNIEPVFDEHSRILILGSFPSVRSRESGFFYGHPQNRFWLVTAAVRNAPVPKTVEEKKYFLLKEKIAVWDTLARCEIKGSADSSITGAEPNDISKILNSAPIERIFTNGKKAFEMYRKYIEPKTGIPAYCLPSTSPANAAYSLERLIEEWRAVNI